jgi:hypothetical protein
VYIQITEGIGVAARALDGPQLSRRPAAAASLWYSRRHTLAAGWWRTIAWCWTVFVTSHSGILTTRRLLLRWLSVSVVAWWRSRGASWKTWNSVPVEHFVGRVAMERECQSGVGTMATYLLCEGNSSYPRGCETSAVGLAMETVRLLCFPYRRRVKT